MLTVYNIIRRQLNVASEKTVSYTHLDVYKRQTLPHAATYHGSVTALSSFLLFWLYKPTCALAYTTTRCQLPRFRDRVIQFPPFLALHANVCLGLYYNTPSLTTVPWQRNLVSSSSGSTSQRGPWPTLQHAATYHGSVTTLSSFLLFWLYKPTCELAYTTTHRHLPRFCVSAVSYTHLDVYKRQHYNTLYWLLSHIDSIIRRQLLSRSCCNWFQLVTAVLADNSDTVIYTYESTDKSVHRTSCL